MPLPANALLYVLRTRELGIISQRTFGRSYEWHAVPLGNRSFFPEQTPKQEDRRITPPSPLLSHAAQAAPVHARGLLDAHWSIFPRRQYSEHRKVRRKLLKKASCRALESEERAKNGSPPYARPGRRCRAHGQRGCWVLRNGVTAALPLMEFFFFFFASSVALSLSTPSSSEGVWFVTHLLLATVTSPSCEATQPNQWRSLHE
ncbi:hypothetical protein B0J12DRAFT_207520 [Macrophomina phaseolina]|uniref:Uncharacterized protein n=1 Tax=Macrophomina phaseolina TaxID=35725 RepID=A0ABQ8G2B0_9PEZI|nr:hypothetical protein B0J12DRAFT_207520 [Macrophomina phaseolina]